MNKDIMYLGIVASRKLRGMAETRVHTQVALRYGNEGPTVAMELFASRLSETYTMDWTFEVLQLTEFEFNALERLDRVDA